MANSFSHSTAKEYIIGSFAVLYLKIQVVPRSKHTVSIIKTSQLMLYGEIIAVCSQIHTKHINTQCRRNVEFLGAFANLRKASIRFVMFVRPNGTARLPRADFHKFDIWEFFENLSRKFKFY